MKTLKLVVSLMLVAMSTFGQSYNPFTQNIEFSPEPTVAGFECGSSQTVQFTQGLTTATDAVLDPNDPLTVTVCLTGFDWDGATPASVVSGSYSTNFNWSFDPFAPLCIVGTQNGTLPGTGTNPLFPNPAAAGPIALALKVPATSPDGTILAVNVNLQVPAYMNATNSAPDDNESTTTQTFCSLKISGNVFDDVDGLTDTDVDGIGIDDPSATPLYANLVDPSGNVENVVPINADGTYEFLDVTPNTTYTVVLSTTQGTVGNPAPAPNLPSDWVNTGESPNNATDDGLVDGITTVVVGTMDVPLIDFGIQQPPTPGMDAETPETNPGGTTCVPVDPTLFSGADPSVGGTITELKICSCPTNATSITINGTFYDCATFPAAGVVIPTNPAGEPTQTICVDPVDGDVTVNIPYSVTDNAGAESACDGSVDLPFETIKISGNVFDDVDGLTDTDVDGTGIDDPSATPLYANLVDPSGNVEDVVPINADGTYEFLDVTPNTTYTIVLSTTQGTVGNPAPSADLPSDWVNTGESPNNATDDGLVDGVNTVVVGTMDVPLIDFGIQQPPTPGMDAETPETNPGGTTCAPVDPTLFSGSDPSVGGTITELKICSCPTNATSITINGTLYDCATFPAAGVVIPTNPAGEPTQTICVDPVDGDVTVNIPYSVTDNAGAESACDGSVDLPFETIKISGNVFDDVDGLTDTDVDGTGIDDPSATPLYANLVDPAGNVEDVVPINADGTYEFLDVTPNTTYTIVLSTTQGTVGNPAPSADLPSDWVNTGESPNNATDDGLVDGVNTVVVGTMDVPLIDFGIQQPPTPGMDAETPQSNPGGTTCVPVDPTLFSGSDPSVGGIITELKICSCPTNATSITINGTLYDCATFPAAGVVIPTNPAGEPTQTICVDPVDGIVTVNIPYSVTDNAGAESACDGSVDIPFDVINISGNVYEDNNGPTNVDGVGIDDPSSTPLYANLVDPSGNVEDVVAINPDGTFEFLDVSPNTTYTVVLSTTQGTVGNPAPAASLPADWTNVSEDCCDNSGNDGMTDGVNTVVVVGSDVPEVNFGITRNYSIGNKVWDDVNQNGIFESTEAGIAGATVNLYEDANNDGVPDGAAVSTTMTDGNGLYVFNDLTSGNYIVGVVPMVPAAGNPYESSVINEANPNADGDDNDNGIVTTAGETFSGTVSLGPGSEPVNELPNNATASDAYANLTVDFGFYQPINVSGNVYLDLTGPANVDGTGIGMANATQLYASLVDPAGNVVGSVPVNSDGTYEFNDVMPNTTYTMVLSTTQGTVGNPAPMPSLPAGFSTVSEDCCDNMGNDGTPDGMTTVVVATSDVPEVNFGITEPLSLGNMVWEDVNGNGLYDTGESGIPGATVNLYQDANNDCTPDGGPIANTTTDMNGLYLFSGLDAGNYVVSVIPPTPASGGSYTSSSPDEGSPNLDVDGNDNGLTTVSLNNETYSCTVTLAAGTEPTGETPDNDLITADANENLTVDFGFIDCPPGFTFTPVEICSADVYDLTTVEPANYTGGIWTDGMNPVADATAAPSGTTYTYTYTNGTCSASGDLVIGLTIPDYTPTLAIAPSAITGASQVRVVANISEILDEPSCSPIYVFIPKDDTRFGFTWDAAATVVGGVGVNNPDWTYFSTNPIFHIWQYTGTTTFPAAGTSNFGFIGTYDPSNTDGETTFSVQIFEGSGGEVNLINNTDSENLLYFRAP